MNQSRVYMDFAAATPLASEVRVAMEPYYERLFYNPSATYSAGREVKQALDVARAQIAAVLGVRPIEIVFTAGGTEANNLAVHGIMRRFPEAELLVSAIEHDSVLRSAEKYTHTAIPVDATGVVDITALEHSITDKTVLISVMYANNEIGTIQPISRIAQLVSAIRRQRRLAGNMLPLYVHTDAAQAGNYLDLHAARLGVDLMTLNGSKIYGPKQSGVLFMAGGVQLSPLIVGGGQERGMRSGTENVAQAVGLATALHRAQENRHKNGKHMAELQISFIDQLKATVPQVIINGSLKNRLPNNVHLTIPDTDNERLLYALDERGVLAAAGSACSASSDEPSHVLSAIGLSDDDAHASLRFTMGNSTTAEHIRYVVQALVDIVP